MTGDPNKKTARTFQCRDVLWDSFDAMARDLDCSVDYLINEAMKQYGKQRNLSSTMSGGTSNNTPEPGAAPSAMRGGQPSMPRLGAPTGLALQRPVVGIQTGSSPQLPTPAAAAPAVPPTFGGTALRVPGLAATGVLPRVPSVPQVPGQAAGRPPPVMPRVPTMTGAAFTPPNLPGAAPAAMPAVPPPPAQGGVPSQTLAGGGGGVALGTLSVLFNGERYPVNTERFIIGRGKQVSDLTVKDPNVSRQHAMIEYQSGAYYIVDMGSTNGVEFQGQRVTRKQLLEGDVCKICDYEFRFTYR